MSSLLYIESSPRKSRSHSIKVADAFLAAYKTANPNDTVDKIDLWDMALPEFDGERINAKYSVMHGESPSGDEIAAWQEVQTLFDRFNQADKYVFSVPMWNFSIPYMLKHYIDVIMQAGILFSYTANGPEGFAKYEQMVCVTSRGSDYSPGSPMHQLDH